MPGLSVIAFMMIIGCVVAKQGEHFFKSGLVILLAIFLHNFLGYVLGYAVSVITGMKGPKRRTLCLEVGMQNAAQAIAVASSPFVFNNDLIAIPAIIYALMMNVILLIYVQVIKK